MAKIEVIFNGEKIIADDSMTILDLAEKRGVEIPTLCHDKRLQPYGSCFVCVAEVKGARTLVPSCATKLREGMEIQTNSERVVASRKTALELITSNHYGDCVAPCKLACPANCDVQGYVGLIANGKYDEALRLIKETIPLPAAIGRVCPKFCEEKCRRGCLEEGEPVAIDYLKRFVADRDLSSENPYLPQKKTAIQKRVAVIGGGPAGLAAAYYLVQEGVEVEIFEAQPKLGGMLRYGIPQYRLPKEILTKEIETITSLGMKVHLNQKLGKDFTIDTLKSAGFDAVFLGFGAWKAARLGIPNDTAVGVFDGIDFLGKVAQKEAVNLHGRVAVIGGGNTAFDCARTALRLGAQEVVMVYRRTREEMPANEIEKEEALEEGVQFCLLTAPLSVVKEGERAVGLKLQKMRLGEPDASGRRAPVPVAGSETEERFDFIITAVGQGPDMAVLGEYQEKLTDGRRMKYDVATGRTEVEFVFAGGDCALGAKTVVEAFGSSKKAVLSILSYFKGETFVPSKEFLSTREKSDGTIAEEYLEQFETAHRNSISVLAPEVRRKTFEEIESVFDEDSARKEAGRCMECGCMDVYECSLKKYSEDYEVQEHQFEGEVCIHKPDDSSNDIFRDPSKCVLCGRCARLCDDVVKIGVYGYVDRGFESTVSPEFQHPLADSDCISCGLCISGCPVGALVPQTLKEKRVPLHPKTVDAFCYHCSNGCKITASILNDSIYDIKEGGLFLCKKGRFLHPAFVPEQTGQDFRNLRKYLGADVYPSCSLSAEDYEALKIAARKLGWRIHNAYAGSSLLRGFSLSGKRSHQSFFTEEIAPESAVVIAGNVEQINPTTLHLLAMKRKPDTRIIFVGEEMGKRLKRMGAISSRKEDVVKELHGVKEILFVINPLDFDGAFGFDASLTLYHTLANTGKDVKVTVLSEFKNLYSAFDATESEEEKNGFKIYIGTAPTAETAGDDRYFGIVILENGKMVEAFPYAANSVTSGSFYNSKGEMYQNVPLYDTKLFSLQHILEEALGDAIPLKLTDFSKVEIGKPAASVGERHKFSFVDTFVQRCSEE